MARTGKLWAKLSFKSALMILVLAGLGSGGWFFASREGGSRQKNQAAFEQGHQRQAIPVLAATAEAKDFPIIVRGIGSVEAFNTVTVKSRVDGNIVQIDFTEGQFVHAGDLLVQIDPRPYQAQLAQAEATKAKDERPRRGAHRRIALATSRGLGDGPSRQAEGARG